MSHTLRMRMFDKEVELDVMENIVNQSTVRNQFFLSPDTHVTLNYITEGRRKGCHLDEKGAVFLLPEDWPTKLFFVESNKPPSRPVTPTDQISISNPYPETPSPPHPTSKSIDSWIFYSVDTAGKSTVVCIHPRYFVTFRHGTHLMLQVGSVMKIFHAKTEVQQNVDNGYNVTVVSINEKLDFILLRSDKIIVQTAPRLVAPQESETFLLAGFGFSNSGIQQLAYLNGIVHSTKEYYCSLDGDQTAIVKGPFYLGTIQSSRGDSGGACWSSRGLIGINYGITSMPNYGFTHLAIHEAAIYSPKNIISPATDILKDLVPHLRIDRLNSPNPPPEKRKPLQTEIEGYGCQTLFVHEELA